MAGNPPSSKGRSLIEFVRDKRREKCKVCQVPDELRRELVAAKGKKIGQEFMLMWLANDHGFELTADELQGHNAGHHDRQLRELEA